MYRNITEKPSWLTGRRCLFFLFLFGKGGRTSFQVEAQRIDGVGDRGGGVGGGRVAVPGAGEQAAEGRQRRAVHADAVLRERRIHLQQLLVAGAEPRHPALPLGDRGHHHARPPEMCVCCCAPLLVAPESPNDN